MSSTPHPPGPGGFLQSTLPSPPPSSVASTTNGNPILPRPRATPLKPGSLKQSNLVEYVDSKLLAISRRYEKRFDAHLEGEALGDVEGVGYKGFGEMAKDLEGVVDVVWVSGTPSLQTYYLLTVALTACGALSAFPFSPPPTFHLINKLDAAFCSLLRGQDADSGEQLPGFDGGRGKLSTTEKVRMRGLVERTRIAVVEVAGKGHNVTATDRSTQTDDDVDYEDDDATIEGINIDGNHSRWEMEIARVYEKTIVELGTSLDNSGSGS
ncbi:MAG: hypothetical protein Q9163_000558 [Psora crenata]